MRNINIFIKTWLRIAMIESINAAFGWATLLNGAALIYINSHLKIIPESNNTWQSNICYSILCFTLGLIISFLFNLIFTSPIKTYLHINPLALSASSHTRPPDFIFNESIKGYSSTIIIKNRSKQHLIDCTAHIEDLTFPNGEKCSRFVEKFDLPPHTTKYLCIAYWFARNHPNIDDKEINLSGPPGNGLGGNQFKIPLNGMTLTVKIEALGIVKKYITCQIFLNKTARILITKQIRESSHHAKLNL